MKIQAIELSSSGVSSYYSLGQVKIIDMFWGDRAPGDGHPESVTLRYLSSNGKTRVLPGNEFIENNLPDHFVKMNLHRFLNMSVVESYTIVDPEILIIDIYFTDGTKSVMFGEETLQHLRDHTDVVNARENVSDN